MGNIKIRKGEFKTRLELIHADVAAGFPILTDDYSHDPLDFNRDFIKHPEASYYGEVEGESMIDAGIYDGDLVIIDRAVEPHNGSIVVAWWEDGFTMKYLDLTHKEEGYIELRPANKDYQSIRIDESDSFEVWGVVIWTIKSWKQ